jgi:mono/diheme cytochrome c family protein
VKRSTSFRARVAALALVFSASGCSWLTDFRQQPAITTWGSQTADWSDTSTPSRGSPQGSVPTTGTAAAGFQYSYGKNPPDIEAFSPLRNPASATQASVDRGWKYYQINCAVCHGTAGLGDGPVARWNGAPNLTGPFTLARTDGYLWGKIRNGGLVMPTFNRIPEGDRWHLVNYIRGLQGRLPRDIVVRKEAVALPGVTGDALPGPEPGESARPRFIKPNYVPTPTGPAKADTARGGRH